MQYSSPSTKRTAISDAAIRRYQADRGIRQLSEPGSSLVFRYSLRKAADGAPAERGSFHLRHYQDGQERWAFIGRWPDITTKQARTLYHRMKETLFLTPDARAIIDRLDTMGDLLQWYQGRVERNQEITKERAAAVIGIIDNHLLPPLATVGVNELTKAQLDRDLIRPLLDRYESSYVRGIVVILKQATKAARSLDLLIADPMAGWTFKDFSPQRVRPKPPKLNQSDLRAVIACMPPTGRVRLLIQLMLSWGTRIGETVALKWQWIDLDRKMLHIPAKVTKTGVQHDVPLTPQVIRILGQWKASQRTNTAFVFPGKPGKSLDVSQMHKEVKKATGGNWTSRELRKLLRTMLGELGVDYYVGERILNHSQGRLDAVYNAALLESQKMRALCDHSDRLEAEGAYT